MSITFSALFLSSHGTWQEMWNVYLTGGLTRWLCRGMVEVATTKDSTVVDYADQEFPSPPALDPSSAEELKRRNQQAEWLELARKNSEWLEQGRREWERLQAAKPKDLGAERWADLESSPKADAASEKRMQRIEDKLNEILELLRSKS